MSTPWFFGAPVLRGVVYVVRDARSTRGALGLCTWDSTGQCWYVHWEPTARVEHFAGDDENIGDRPEWPASYLWTRVDL